jgi:MFS family permease
LSATSATQATEVAQREAGTTRLMAVVACAFVLESALYSTLAALLPHYERRFDLSSFGSGVLAGCYSGGMVVGILVAGLWVSDRLGVRRTALSGCAMLAAASLAFGAASSLGALEGARLVQGIGAGLVWCSLLNWLIAMVPASSRGAALGAAMGAGVFGMAAGPLLGAATQAVGTFAVFAAVTAALLLYMVVLVRTPSPPALGARRPARLRLPADREMRRVIALVAVPPLIAGAVITIVPLQLSGLGASEAAIDAALLAGALLSAVCCVYAGNVADVRGHLGPVLLGALACAVTLLAMAAADSVLPIALAYVVFQSLGLGFFWIPLMSLFSERGEALDLDPAAVALLLNLAITVAYTLGPPLLTAVQEGSSAAVAYLVMVALTLAAMAGLALTRRPG